MGKLFLLVALSMIATPSYGQNVAVNSQVEGMRAYVEQLEDRLVELSNDFSELSSDYATLNEQYVEQKNINDNILVCNRKNPPQLYIGGIGCKSIAIEPCKLCDANGDEVSPTTVN